MRLIVLLVLVSLACLALGAFLHANLWNVAIGLAAGGGVSGVLTLIIRALKQDDPSA